MATRKTTSPTTRILRMTSTKTRILTTRTEDEGTDDEEEEPEDRYSQSPALPGRERAWRCTWTGFFNDNGKSPPSTRQSPG